MCGDNSGHHLYLNVEGRATTDLTFILSQLQERLYSCPDKFGVLGLEPNVLDTSTLDTGMRVDFSNPIVNIGNMSPPSHCPSLTSCEQVAAAGGRTSASSTSPPEGRGR